MTVAELKQYLEGVDDDAQVVFHGPLRLRPLVVRHVRYGGPVVLAVK